MGRGLKRAYSTSRNQSTKKECNFYEKCYRRNPDHFREYDHSHLKKILAEYPGIGEYNIPANLNFQKDVIKQQLDVLKNHAIYPICRKVNRDSNPVNSQAVNDYSSSSNAQRNDSTNNQAAGPSNVIKTEQVNSNNNPNDDDDDDQENKNTGNIKMEPENIVNVRIEPDSMSHSIVEKIIVEKAKDLKNDMTSIPKNSDITTSSKDIKPETMSSNNISVSQNLDVAGCSKNIKSESSDSKSNIADVKPSKLNNARRIEDFFNVVAPKGKMKEKHEKAAPYYMFFTTITSSPITHSHPLSITFQELLDPSLGKLKSSLQMNFLIDLGWLLAQYYFAGYSDKPLTILYGEEADDLKTINQKRPNVDAHLVPMKNAFGKHHTKMSILHYEDGSIRLVISTANLYIDDWENRTQGLWLSPVCHRLPDPLDVINGESPTGFKRSLINYLNSYGMPCLSPYLQIVKNIDFSHINVFFVASIPGGHFDSQWGLSCVNNLLSKHCMIPQNETDKWTLIAQASSIGSYGNDPKLWLCGDFQSSFCRSVNKSPMMTKQPEFKLIYPSLNNVKNSHDNLLGGGCLPYSNSIHLKQPWLNRYLHEWSAVHSGRNRAMPHIKSYLRLSPDMNKAPFFLLTSANVSKSAWGTYNKGNRALRINSYEVGVLFLPKFIINEDYFYIELDDPKRLPIPYDLPPIPYEIGDNPWVMDYLS